MNRTGFDELITSIKQQAPKRVAVVAAARVAMCLEELGCPAADACIVDAANHEDAIRRSLLGGRVC